MWVHFNLPCGREVQHRLHSVFRHRIANWEKKRLANGAVLTFHYRNHSSDSLYVCLNLPRVKEPNERETRLTGEAIEQIPLEIMSALKQICSDNDVELVIKDYEFALRKQKARSESEGKSYYRGAPVKEILHFASVGTKIALKILDMVEAGEEYWASDKDLATYITSQLQDELGRGYFWLPEASHFVCNPLLLSEPYLWTLAQSATSTKALEFLRKRVAS